MLNFLKKVKFLFPFIKKPEKIEESFSKAIKKINFEKFQDSIHYKILDKNYFITALTHRSFLKIRKDPLKAGVYSNERLEFLGDAVLDLVVAEFLFKNFPLNEEGDL